jgi:uncharacterized protein (DUF983 family)
MSENKKKKSLIASTVLSRPEDPKEGAAVKGFIFECPYCKATLKFGPITSIRVACAACGRKFQII